MIVFVIQFPGEILIDVQLVKNPCTGSLNPSTATYVNRRVLDHHNLESHARIYASEMIEFILKKGLPSNNAKNPAICGQNNIPDLRSILVFDMTHGGPILIL